LKGLLYDAVNDSEGLLLTGALSASLHLESLLSGARPTPPQRLPSEAPEYGNMMAMGQSNG